MAEVEELLKSKGLAEEKAGSWMIDLAKHTGKKLGTGIIRDRTGSSTYLLRDLAAVLERYRKYSFDKMIYVVEAGQHTTHFVRLFNILELMGMPDLASKLLHAHFGDGSNVSQQFQDKPGLIQIMPDEILVQCESEVQSFLEKNPEKATFLVGKNDGETVPMIATNALIAEELSSRRANNHASFDISRIKSFELGTGLELQYWYARLCSIVETNQLESDKSLSDEEWKSLERENEVDLFRLLAQYPDITYFAYETLEPATIMTYLNNVTAQLSMIFSDDEDESVASPAHVALYEATRGVLESGMKLLGMNYGK
jgi:arginyl-tRNA synthetase